MAQVFETVAKGGVIHLPSSISGTAHCIVTILDGDLQSLREQSQSVLPETKQRRMSSLLQKHRDGDLASDEAAELDALSEDFDAATLAKGRALAALAQLNDHPPRG